MNVDAAKEADEAAHALEVADALGRTSNNTNSGTGFDDVTNSLRELDMEHYDEEDDGILPALVLFLSFFCLSFPYKFYFYLVLKRKEGEKRGRGWSLLYVGDVRLDYQNLDQHWP